MKKTERFAEVYELSDKAPNFSYSLSEIERATGLREPVILFVFEMLKDVLFVESFTDYGIGRNLPIGDRTRIALLTFMD
jgi:hypothetical protein